MSQQNLEEEAGCGQTDCRKMKKQAMDKRTAVKEAGYDDPSFIVLTETKFSFRCIPVWDQYSPHRTRVEIKKHM